MSTVTGTKRIYRKKSVRTSDEQNADHPMPVLKVGDTDSMSIARRRAMLPLCWQAGCTRAAGHDNAGRYGEPGPRLHVRADRDGTVIEVWDAGKADR